MNPITIKQIVNAVYSSNTFILTYESNVGNKEFWIIDVGDTCEIIKRIPTDAIIKGVLLTHTHFDHTYGINQLLDYYPDARLYTNEVGKRALCSPKLNYSRYHHETSDIVCSRPENINVIKNGERLSLFGKMEIEVIATPGHDASCLTYLIGDYVFSGDSYIPGVKPRATYLLSDKQSVISSENKIKELANHKTLCPGHGLVYSNYNNNNNIL